MYTLTTCSIGSSSAKKRDRRADRHLTYTLVVHALVSLEADLRTGCYGRSRGGSLGFRSVASQILASDIGHLGKKEDFRLAIMFLSIQND